MDRQYGLEQAVCYMRSRDRAKTWERADGSAIEVPTRPEQMDLLVGHAEPFDRINPGSRLPGRVEWSYRVGLNRKSRDPLSFSYG